MNLSKKISALLDALGLKQKDFALSLGLGQSQVSQIARGVKGITKGVKTAITLRYNVNPVWWTDDSAPMFQDDKQPEIQSFPLLKRLGD